jgi:2-hydroxychromene-2-carboxylate isomerase
VSTRFYFSFRSPYSWLAYRDLMARHPDVAQAAEWRPFWEPDEESRRLLAEAEGAFPYVDMSRAKALYILQDVRRLARSRGLANAWPVDRKPRWEVSHLAYLVARAQGAGPQFVEAVYRARWELGLDISEPATITAIGADLGLDPAALATAPDDPAVRRQGLRALLDIDADGVFGVPFFIHRRDKFWGLDRLPDFVAAVRGDAPAPASDRCDAPAPANGRDPELEPVAAGGDQGHAGGCG